MTIWTGQMSAILEIKAELIWGREQPNGQSWWLALSEEEKEYWRIKARKEMGWKEE